MPRFIASRLGKMALILVGIVILNFALIHAAPGDPASVMAGEAGDADAAMQELGSDLVSYGYVTTTITVAIIII